MPKNSPLTSRERRSKTKKLRFDWRPLGRGGGRAEEWLTDSELCVSFLLLLCSFTFLSKTQTSRKFLRLPFAVRMPVRRTNILCLMFVGDAKQGSTFAWPTPGLFTFMPIIIQICLVKIASEPAHNPRSQRNPCPRKVSSPKCELHRGGAPDRSEVPADHAMSEKRTP